jgi:hypothetical protein
VVPYVMELSRFEKIFNLSLLMQPQKITLADNGLILKTEKEDYFWLWEVIKKAEIVDGYFYFTLLTGKIHIIPLRYFSSWKEAIDFYAIINRNIGYKEISQARKIKKLYYWGLVGIIPFYGLILGVILIINGLKYKENKLTLLGIADILLTVLFFVFEFSSLFS